jgi:hypothetical protein
MFITPMLRCHMNSPWRERFQKDFIASRENIAGRRWSGRQENGPSRDATAHHHL